LVRQVRDIVPKLITYERKAREFLVLESEQDLQDDVSRALGILCTAKKISSEETMHYLSKVRMGVNLGLIDDVKSQRSTSSLSTRSQPTSRRFAVINSTRLTAILNEPTIYSNISSRALLTPHKTRNHHLELI